MKNLLELQRLDLAIEKLKERELAIPKQKEKYATQRARLEEELAASEGRPKALQLEQRQCEGDIEQAQEKIKKYEGQLPSIKKNEEYTALLHEIDEVKRQIGQKEERILNIMMELDEARATVEEDRTRIKQEEAGIDAECAKIDAELAETVKERKALEAEREPVVEQVDPTMLSRYRRIRKSKGGGVAIAPLDDEVCGACHMKVTAQVVNEILGGSIHPCAYCGVILYDPGSLADESAVASS